VAAELIAAKAGLGQAIQYHSAVFNVAGVFGVLTVLAVVASALAWLVRKAEAYALAWRPTSQ
jgi:ABC-type nitrate/sulfonate/bicarbonate transport system permease component